MRFFRQSFPCCSCDLFFAFIIVAWCLVSLVTMLCYEVSIVIASRLGMLCIRCRDTATLPRCCRASFFASRSHGVSLPSGVGPPFASVVVASHSRWPSICYSYSSNRDIGVALLLSLVPYRLTYADARLSHFLHGAFCSCRCGVTYYLTAMMPGFSGASIASVTCPSPVFCLSCSL